MKVRFEFEIRIVEVEFDNEEIEKIPLDELRTQMRGAAAEAAERIRAENGAESAEWLAIRVRPVGRDWVTLYEEENENAVIYPSLGVRAELENLY